MSGAGPRPASLWPRAALREGGDVGISEGNARVRRSGLGLPPPQVFEDAQHDTRIVDQREDAHRPLALGALRGVGFIDLARISLPHAYLARAANSLTGSMGAEGFAWAS